MSRLFLFLILILIALFYYVGRSVVSNYNAQNNVHQEKDYNQYTKSEIDEQKEFLNRLIAMESSDTEVLINKDKKEGRFKYPIRERDTVLNCLNKNTTKLPNKLNHFTFSGCEKVTLENWQGSFDSTSYDEVWDYEIRTTQNQPFEPNDKGYTIMQRGQVFWRNKKIALELVYSSDGYIMVIRDKVYFDKLK